MVAIVAFVVPPAADERFLAAWSDPGATLHRALRPDVPFRFLAVGGAGASVPAFESRAGRFRIVHEDGAPDGRDGVLRAVPFEVPAADAERFVARWHDARAALAGERGYLGTRLHEAPGGAAFRFVELGRWSSPLMVSRALGRPAVRSAQLALPWPSYPAVVQVVGPG